MPYLTRPRALYAFAACLLLTAAVVSRHLLSQQTAGQSAHSLRAAAGLEASLWASEPDVINPTNIDVDARGRVWVLEAVNYRRRLRSQQDLRPGGDRIVILEDTDFDGRADKTRVFAQDPDLRSPLGIAVLGDKVIVSQSPDLIVFTRDEQDNIIKKEILLTGWRGFDHDHGVHAVVFGPDGRYYLNAGDQGFDITDRSGQRFVSSRSGPYYAGCVLRLNPDGTEFTVLAHNFRNPYEIALDSFGNIWQTDNDDDGHKWVRVNYVMEGGNFGYWGPGGRSWREDKGTHFHSELPGVVPNVARTGQGAPCGLAVYEGTLLPEKYRGQLIHAEAGKRLINTYYILPDGAGYSIRIEDTVAAEDTWFRPSDVCVAPDGSIFISDWYDPSVGGHLMDDAERGRIYRLAPAGHRPRAPEINLETPEGLAAALGSPAQSVRYLAYRRLRSMGRAALPALKLMAEQGDRILRARALWLLGGLAGEGRKLVYETLQDPEPDFRILATRVLRLYETDMTPVLSALARDPSPQVRREVALALQGALPGSDAEKAAVLELLVELCKQQDGRDRWYLEALGIAARGKENALYERLGRVFPQKWNSVFGQLLWEFRPADALPYLAGALNDARLSVSERAEALDALSAMALPQAGIAVAEFIAKRANEKSPAELTEKAFSRLSQQLFSEWIPLRKDPAVVGAVTRSLADPGLQEKAVDLVNDLGDPAYGPALLAIARSSSAAESVRRTAIEALGRTRDAGYLDDLAGLADAGPMELRMAAVRAIGYLRPRGEEDRFKRIILSQAANEIRAEAVRALGRFEQGLNLLLDMEEGEQLPAELRSVAGSLAQASPVPAIRQRAARLLPPLRGKNQAPLPPIKDLHWRSGEAERGKQVFLTVEGPKCHSCHSLGEGKKRPGPDLASIGDKMGKEALLEAILNPSAGIAPQFYTWILETETQGLVTGILVEDTPERILLQTESGEELRFRTAEVKSRRRSNLSLMPEDLAGTMTEQELVDLVEFLTTLKAVPK